jgi:alpha-beta hydrolase superfamily lysophospholipase
LSKSRFAIAALVLLGAALWLLTPARLEYAAGAQLPALPAAPAIAGTEERVLRTVDPGNARWVVVALHGFSASRQETAPLAETVAQQLGANLVEVRLSGHGLAENPLAGVRAEHWLNDAQKAFSTAAELGERIIVIGTSTGATLTAALLDQDFASHIDTLVMISPNFAPRDPKAKWLTRPAGPLIAQLVAGDTRCWTPTNDLQDQYWSNCYPMAAAVEMMRLVDRANRILPADISQRLLMFYSPDDKVISPDAALEIFEATGSPMKKAIEIRDPGDPSHHVLAGDILSPAKTREIADAIIDFIERPIP